MDKLQVYVIFLMESEYSSVFIKILNVINCVFNAGVKENS